MIALSYSIGEDSIIPRSVSVNDLWFKIMLWVKGPLPNRLQSINMLTMWVSAWVTSLNRLVGHVYVKCTIIQKINYCTLQSITGWSHETFHPEIAEYSCKVLYCWKAIITIVLTRYLPPACKTYMARCIVSSLALNATETVWWRRQFRG